MEKVMVEMPAMEFKMPAAKIAVRPKLPPATLAPIAGNPRVSSTSRITHGSLSWDIDVRVGITRQRCRKSMLDNTPVSGTDRCTPGESTFHLGVG